MYEDIVCLCMYLCGVSYLNYSIYKNRNLNDLNAIRKGTSESFQYECLINGFYSWSAKCWVEMCKNSGYSADRQGVKYLQGHICYCWKLKQLLARMVIYRVEEWTKSICLWSISQIHNANWMPNEGTTDAHEARLVDRCHLNKVY